MEWVEAKEKLRRFLITDEKTTETARTYVNNAGRFWRWCLIHELAPACADKAIVQEWLTERRAAVSSGRVHNDLAAVRKLYEWLLDIHAVEENPTIGLRIKRPKVLATPPLSPTEVGAMLASCRYERDSLIVLLLAYSGVRIAEFANMQEEHIDWDRGEIRIFGKGEKERLVAPSAEVMARLHSFLGLFHSGPIWRSIKRKRELKSHQVRKIIYRIAEEAGLTKVHPHRFRATFATEFMEQFGDLQALQDAMGHESIETTARYSESTRRRRSMEKMRRLRIDTVPARRPTPLRIVSSGDR